MRKAASAASSRSTSSLWSTAACAAARPSPSSSTPSASVEIANSMSARAAAPTRSTKRPGSAASASKRGGSLFESNLENEGSISGSDSTFYRQSEGHSVMDTLAVALRVAEEAIEEAISKAEAYGDSLDKQNEASYLRDHKEELTEELATTILQKIIRKQKSKSEQQVEEEPGWPHPQSCSTKVADEGTSASPGGYRAPAALWRSQSAFSITGEEALKTPPVEAASRQPRDQGQHPRAESALPSWKSVDRLDETNLAPVLQSPDGNWVALKDGAPPPTRLLAKPKSGTFQALEVASSVASAYDEMGSDSEEDFDWSEALSKLCPRSRALPRNPQPQPTQAQSSDQGPIAASPSSALSPNPEAMCSDSETSSAGSSREVGHQARLSWLQRKAPRNPAAEKMRLHGELDMNFNPQVASRETSDSSEPEEAPHTTDRRARRWRRARLGSEEPSKEPSSPSAQLRDLDTHQVSDDLSETDISNEARDPQTLTDTTEEKRRNRLYELAMKMSEKETSSGEDQESEPKTESENQKESLSSEDNSQSVQEELKKKFSAVSLCNISTEVLKVINATEELIAGSTGPWESPQVPPERQKGMFPRGTDQVRLDEQLTSLEENISDIESRISALTIAGLNIAPCVRFTRRRDQKQRTQVQTIDTSRQQRRKLPAPPVKAEKMETSSVTTIKTFNHNFILQGSSTNRTKERKGTTKDLMEPALESAVMY
uniref:Myosin VIIA and Rab interacting protein n=1 Tax=Pan troglodytes TaxID=9598 RepID=A0A2I3SHI5_PANTR